MSQSGLYGVNGLPGGSGPDFGVQDIAPPTDRSELAKTRGKWKVAALKAKPLPYMHPETIKELISVLSTPEILQILAKWHITHPLDIPLGNKIQRSELVELIVRAGGEALADVVRVTTAKGNRSKGGKQEVKVIGARAKTAAYLSTLAKAQEGIGKPPPKAKTPPSLLPRISDAGDSLEGRSRSMSAEPALYGHQHEGNQASVEHAPADRGEMSTQLGESEERKKRRRHKGRRRKHRDAGGAGSSSLSEGGLSGSHAGSQGSDITVGRRGMPATMLSSKELKAKAKLLASELQEAQTAREEYMVELAKKGLLAVTVDNELSFPVMRGNSMRMTNVSRNMQAISGFHNQKFNRKMVGLNVDETLKRVSHQVSPSIQSLCL